MTALGNDPGGFFVETQANDFTTQRHQGTDSNGDAYDYTGYSVLVSTPQSIFPGYKYRIRVTLRGTQRQVFPVTNAPRGQYIYRAATDIWEPYTP